MLVNLGFYSAKMKGFAVLFCAFLAAMLNGAVALQLRGFLGGKALQGDTLLTRFQTSSTCPTTYDDSEEVKALFVKSSGHWEQCRKDIEPSRQFAEDVNDVFGVILKTAKSVEQLTEVTAKSAKKVETVAKTHLSKLQSIPKVGKVVKVLIEVIDEAEDILFQTNEKVEDARKIIERLELATKVVSISMDKIASETSEYADRFDKAAKFESALIACTRKSSSCADDAKVENANSAILGVVKAAESVSGVCPKTFGALRRILEGIRKLLDVNIFDQLLKIVEKVKKALQPVLDKVSDILNEIGKHLSAAYCCTTPLIGQIAFKGISQVLNLATCPIDSLNKGLEDVLKELQNFVNDALFSFIRKIVEQLPDITFKFPALEDGQIELSTCDFKLPRLTTKSQSLLKPLLTALASSGKPSLKPIGTAFGNIGKNIRDDCKEALREVGKNLAEDCCKFFHPLRDGLFCDPTNTVPFKHCSQCKSGKFSFHVKKVHVACGIDDTLKDVATKVGDGVKDAANKVGDAAKKAGKTVKNTAKKIGKGFKKVFG